MVIDSYLKLYDQNKFSKVLVLKSTLCLVCVFVYVKNIVALVTTRKDGPLDNEWQCEL